MSGQVFWQRKTCSLRATLTISKVCELDLIFNFHKAYYVLDELLSAGEIQESSKRVVLKSVVQADSQEGASVEEEGVAGYVGRR